MKKNADSIDSLEIIAKEVLASCSPQKKATIVGLSGDLGSGKTTFTQQIAKILGISEVVTSPTFVIEKIYKVQKGPFEHLIHIDAYRLESAKELQKLGWNETIADPKNLILIEWPEKVEEILPADTRFVRFTFIDERTREVELAYNTNV